MVVEDDPAMQHSLKFFLEVEGYTVTTHTAETSAEADHDLKDAACVIIDQTLRGTSGLDYLEELRWRGYLSPAILIASHPDARTQRGAEEAGAFVVEKPLLGDVLHLTLELAIMQGPVAKPS